MTSQEYAAHYFVIHDVLLYLAVALIGALTCLFFILLTARLTAKGRTRLERRWAYYERALNMAQRFDEMVFSATSILSFLAVYYLIDRFATDPGFLAFWDKWSDYILLGMIVVSCIVNNYFDVMLIPLKKITRDEKASVRLVGMFYVLLIFLYIKFVYENDNYDGFIMYFLGLVIGRFVYFDASFRGSIQTIKDGAKNIPFLILGLIYAAFMCIYGFGTDYLLISNGVLVSTFIAHLFMVVAIFILHHSHLIYLFARKPKQLPQPVTEYDYEEEDYTEYDNYEEY
ncbi:MAG: hypothetical protein J5518_03000 [Lachnospiraceae bacterium]|nr:hypothetical protein [Lachnospiraceae bacterium]